MELLALSDAGGAILKLLDVILIKSKCPNVACIWHIVITQRLSFFSP